MKFQLLPSTFDADGGSTERQHSACCIINGCAAFDAGSLAMACTDEQRSRVRDIVLTHTHLDHIAGLPLFIDDLFATLTSPVRVHASRVMIDRLRRHIFNGAIYPDFTKIENARGRVLEFVPYEFERSFSAAGLMITPVAVNHSEESAGFIVDSGDSKLAITGDTSETSAIWSTINKLGDVSTILVECAFPNEMAELAASAGHLTPESLKAELSKLDRFDGRIYVINIKPMYHRAVIAQLDKLSIPRLEAVVPGRIYMS